MIHTILLKLVDFFYIKGQHPFYPKYTEISMQLNVHDLKIEVERLKSLQNDHGY